MSTPERFLWTRRWVLACLAASLAAVRAARPSAAQVRPLPRPGREDAVFVEGVFEDGVFD